MDIVTKHILDNLDKFLLEENNDFAEIYELVRNPNKFRFKLLLKYTHKILELFHSSQTDELCCFHIHMEQALDSNSLLTIAEFLIVFYFIKYMNSDQKGSNNEELVNKINSLKKTIEGDLQVPSKVTKIQLKKLFYERDLKKLLLKEYKSLPQNCTLAPKLIWNNNIYLSESLTEIFNTRPHITTIEKLGNLNSYVVTNSNPLTQLKNIKIGSEHFLKFIESVLLFDCENSVKRFNEFNFDLMKNLNLNHGTRFRSLIFITFGKSIPSINDIRKEIELIKTRFKVPSERSYIIRTAEISHLTNKLFHIGLSVNFYGASDLSTWNTLVFETKMVELYELQSIKLMNIYSLAFNGEIKTYILNELFNNPFSSLLTEETKSTILTLDRENLEIIKTALSETLEFIVKSEWLQTVKHQMPGKTTIVISDEAIKDHTLNNKIRTVLDLHKSVKMVSWNEFDIPTDSCIAILAFRDQGRFPYNFSPNIIESDLFDTMNVTALFIRYLFETKFKWANYNLTKDTYRLMSHPIRVENFSWRGLYQNVKLEKPSISNFTNWDLEHDYANLQNRMVCKVKFKTVKLPKLFSPSDLFIVKTSNGGRFTAERIVDLLQLDLEDNTLYAQDLEQIEEGINIYEKMFDSKTQDEELNLIKAQFDVAEKEKSALWKVLLKQRSIVVGPLELYNELKQYFLSHDLKCVSFFHFKNAWIDSNSKILTPLSKKVFRALCSYLKIPDSYYLIMQRLRNSSKEATRQSTIQMNYLLKDLFNDGCFDDNVSPIKILKRNENKYIRNHPLDDIGIDQNHLVENLVALVDLIKPEISLLEIESIEKINYE